MSKLFLFAAIAVVIWWMWRKLQAKRPGEGSPVVDRPAEPMAACAYCGVNQPRSECVEHGGRVYCSEAHRQAAEREGQHG